MLAASIKAQNNRLSTYNQIGWYNLFGIWKINSKWSIHTEYQWRRNNIITQSTFVCLGKASLLRFQIKNSAHCAGFFIHAQDWITFSVVLKIFAPKCVFLISYFLTFNADTSTAVKTFGSR